MKAMGRPDQSCRQDAQSWTSDVEVKVGVPTTVITA
jgi:hypothetical protein